MRDLEPGVLWELYRKGLVYLDIPILLHDRFSIPPLEVRRRQAMGGEGRAGQGKGEEDAGGGDRPERGKGGAGYAGAVPLPGASMTD